MRTPTVLLAVVTVALTAVAPVPVEAAPPEGPEDVEDPDGRVVVLWDDDVPAPARAAALSRYGTHTPRSGPVDTVTVGAGRVAQVAAEVASLEGVLAAEPDRTVHLAAEEPDLAPVPTDPLFAEQWALENTGQLVGLDGEPASTAGVDVGARTAWARTRGNGQVTVAVIDSGVDLSHPDLDGAFWENPAEVVDGTDTAGNGFVDDVNGWDFVAGGPVVATDHLSLPAEAHGTQVAGVIAARTDDLLGVTGLAPEVRIMPVRGFEQIDEAAAGSSDIPTLVEAIAYAVANGAQVINASWEAGLGSPVLERAVADAGIPVVAAAGNRGSDLDGPATAIPAAFDLPNVVAVTAIGPRGELPAFASFGATTIDLGAPGVGIVTTDIGGGHTTLAGGAVSGTSFATPFVSAALALALSVEPTTSTSDLVDAVLRTTTATPSLAGRTTTGGWLDAGALLAGLERPVCGREDLPVAGFEDVEPTATHGRAIDCIAELGITAGFDDGTFRPDDEVTRGQLATFLDGVLVDAGVLAEDPAAREPDDFPDAFTDDDGSVHEPAVDALAALDILRGDDEGLIRHHAPVTRGQLAAMLVRTHAVVDGVMREPSRSWFQDTPATTHATAIDVARDLGLVRGRDRVIYSPEVTTRRGQMASTLARLVDSLARETG